jgi:hypothetical protein
LVGVLCGVIIWINENTFGMGYSVVVGTCYSGLYWVTLALLCTNEFRQAMLKSSPCVGRVCPCLVDENDGNENNTVHTNKDHIV